MSRFRLETRAVLGVCVLLAIVHTWPLVTAPATLSRNDNADAELNQWAMAWVAHELPRAPSRLFDGNFFYPERLTLAYSEPLIVPALMGAPLLWSGASPVLSFNIVLILGFALTAFAGYVLVHAWTGDRAAGLLAGSMFAFNTHTLTRLAHIQGIHAWGLPLTLLSTDRILVHRRWRDAIWLAVWMAAMAATSGYLVVFGAVLIAVVLVARTPDWWGHARRIAMLFASATAMAGVAILPIYLPYRRLAQSMGMSRTLDSVTAFSATPNGYLATAGRFHHWAWSARFVLNPVDMFFPGVVVIVLALLAIYWAFVRAPARGGAVGGPETASISGRLTRRRVLMLAALAVTGFVLSLGIRTPVYGWVFHVFPPMQGLRAAARFGNLFLLAMAGLAGIGLAAARVRLAARGADPAAFHGAPAFRHGLSGPKRAGLVVAALVVVANVEALRAPLGYTRFKGIPAIYSLLAKEPGRVVLVEVPFYPPQLGYLNAKYVLNSTAHWRPLMNGYSGYFPVSYRERSKTFWFFPREHAIQAMREAGATHVMIHPGGWGSEAEDMWRAVAASPFLERIAITPDGPALYRLK
jgi:hypothetical protein